MESSGTYQDQQSQDNRKLGYWSSIVIHFILILILILPLFRFPIPPPGQRGILVSFGNPDIGQGNDLPETQNEELVKPQPETKTAAASVSTPEIVKEEITKEQTQKLMTTEVDPAIKIQAEKERQRKIEEELRLRKLEEDRKKAEEEEARRIAEEEARKKAEYEQKKAQFGNVLGKGKGSTTAEGNEGDPTGKPDAEILKGVSKGSGRVGEGLSNRGITYEPTIHDSSQKTGKVVIRVCVDTNGNIAEARFTQRGSTTTDSELVGIALENVKKYKFTESEIEEQCGTITIDFKLRG